MNINKTTKKHEQQDTEVEPSTNKLVKLNVRLPQQHILLKHFLYVKILCQEPPLLERHKREELPAFILPTMAHLRLQSILPILDLQRPVIHNLTRILLHLVFGLIEPLKH